MYEEKDKDDVSKWTKEGYDFVVETIYQIVKDQ